MSVPRTGTRRNTTPRTVIAALALTGCFITKEHDEAYRGYCALECGASSCTPSLDYAQSDLEACFQDPETGAWSLPPVLASACPTPTTGCHVELPAAPTGGEIVCEDDDCTWNARDEAFCLERARDRVLSDYGPVAHAAYDLRTEIALTCPGLDPIEGAASVDCAPVTLPDVVRYYPLEEHGECEELALSYGAEFVIDPTRSRLTMTDPWGRTDTVTLTGRILATGDGHLVDGVVISRERLDFTTVSADEIRAMITAPIPVQLGDGWLSIPGSALAAITVVAERPGRNEALVAHPTVSGAVVGAFDPIDGTWSLSHARDAGGWHVAVELGGRIFARDGE